MKTRLNEELFMQEIAHLDADALDRLSRNPLFLTVMVYVYVNRLRESGIEELPWRPDELGLVDMCISLLLEDIDKEKARHLPDAERRALMKRRASHPTEKRQFLQFIAAESYREDKGVLAYEYLVQKASLFFSGSMSPHRDDILRGLRTEDGTTNLVLQTIFCGVLVLASSGINGRFFDFPHRRFREVLAADYFDSSQGLRELLLLSDHPSFAELAKIYVERTGRLDELLAEIEIQIRDGKGGASLLKLLVALLPLQPKDRRVEIAERAILAAAMDPRGRAVPSGLLRFLRPNMQLAGRLRDTIATCPASRVDALETLLRQPLQFLEATEKIPDLNELQKLTQVAGSMAGAFSSGPALTVGGLVQMLAQAFPDRRLSSLSPQSVLVLKELVDGAATYETSSLLRQAIAFHFSIDTKSHHVDNELEGAVEEALRARPT